MSKIKLHAQFCMRARWALEDRDKGDFATARQWAESARFWWARFLQAA